MKEKKRKDFSGFLGSRKAFEIIWNFWVVMVLAVVFLILVLFFFTKSYEGFLDEIRNYFTKSNVDAVVKQCNLLVDSGNKYEFCCNKKNVKYFVDKKIKSENFTCFELINKNFVNKEIKNEVDCFGYEC